MLESDHRSSPQIEVQVAGSAVRFRDGDLIVRLIRIGEQDVRIEFDTVRSVGCKEFALLSASRSRLARLGIMAEYGIRRGSATRRRPRRFDVKEANTIV